MISAITIFSLSCHSSMKSERRMWYYKNWQQSYKDRALCKCLLSGYKDTAIVNKIARVDRSLYDPLAMAIFDSSIDQLVAVKMIAIQKDSAESYQTVAEAAAGKNVFNQCMEFYKGKTLKNASKVEKKKWKKIKNISSAVSAKVPSA